MPSNTPSPTTRKQILLRRYEIGKVLGQGSFGKVYVATNLVTNQLAAIKVIDKEKILKTGLIAHIKREISILRRVRHPNIVQLYEVMATKTKIYFVMEYVTGGELFTKVAKGRLKEEVARKYFQQLISAVGFCHARGVYHRDLKPENILLDENGDLKVSDFGLSAISEQICADGLFYTFCGTPAYVAPEVLGRKGYEASKVDIWACGVILFVLMAGYLPFRDQNVMVMYRKIFKGEFRKPRWFSGELSRLLKRLLDTSPETRISIQEIMEDKWFKKGFKQVKFYFEDDKICSVKDGEEGDDGCIEYCSDQSCCDSESELVDGKRRSSSSSGSVSNLPRPMSLNAFDLILFSPRFSLSGLFEDVSEESRFLTSESVSRIVNTVEEIAKGVGFSIRRKDCRISLEGSKEGVKGPLMLTVEIFELTPILRVVEVKKSSGDRNEYEEFCESQLKPGLQPLVLSGSREPSQLLSNTPNEEINGIE
uniref:CBL-interacting serine/threonine-protein kinase 12-like n=1 Tax=Erigeron canadensis TaxID=72917 RepID=UPI001CB9893D|nr:CBL-interacting serine/threonine-protein kinase 12-like [Erigeron canadensis]